MTANPAVQATSVPQPPVQPVLQQPQPIQPIRPAVINSPVPPVPSVPAPIHAPPAQPDISQGRIQLCQKKFIINASL